MIGISIANRPDSRAYPPPCRGNWRWRREFEHIRRIRRVAALDRLQTQRFSSSSPRSSAICRPRSRSSARTGSGGSPPPARPAVNVTVRSDLSCVPWPARRPSVPGTACVSWKPLNAVCASLTTPSSLPLKPLRGARAGRLRLQVPGCAESSHRRSPPPRCADFAGFAQAHPGQQLREAWLMP